MLQSSRQRISTTPINHRCVALARRWTAENNTCVTQFTDYEFVMMTLPLRIHTHAPVTKWSSSRRATTTTTAATATHRDDMLHINQETRFGARGPAHASERQHWLREATAAKHTETDRCEYIVLSLIFTPMRRTSHRSIGIKTNCCSAAEC